MLLKFVDNLDVGNYTSLNRMWLKELNAILKKAESNSIKRIRLVRLSKTNNFRNGLIENIDSRERVIYEVDMNGLSFYVNLAQIYAIIRKEEWINGEVNCLLNLASSQIITISWGAKKKESTHSEGLLTNDCLHVGDNVIVLNHGIHWRH